MGPPTRCAIRNPGVGRKKHTTTTIRTSPVLISRNLALSSVFAAFYAALVIVFAGNSVYPFQVRVADILLPLTVLFGWPAIIGLTLGAAVGNFGADSLVGLSSASTGIDVVGGSVANLIAGYLAWKIGATRWKPKASITWIIGSLGEAVIVLVALQPFVGLEWAILVGVIISGLLAYAIGRKGWSVRYNVSWALATVVETIVVSLVVGSYLGEILPFPLSLQVAISGVLFGSIIAINLGGSLLLSTLGRPGTLKALRSWVPTVYDPGIAES